MRRMELVSLRRSRHRLWSRLRSRPRRRHHHDVTHFGRLTLRVQQRRNLMGMSVRCGRDQQRVGHGRRIGGLETLNTRTSSLCRKGLLSEWKMAMPRGEALRLEQETVDASTPYPRIGVRHRRGGPARPGLGNQRIGLQFIQHFIALPAELLHLLRRWRSRKRAVGGIDLFLKPVRFRPKRHQFMHRAFILAERGDGLRDFMRAVRSARITTLLCSSFVVIFSSSTLTIPAV
jgi:hypothetical protein